MKQIVPALLLLSFLTSCTKDDSISDLPPGSEYVLDLQTTLLDEDGDGNYSDVNLSLTVQLDPDQSSNYSTSFTIRAEIPSSSGSSFFEEQQFEIESGQSVTFQWQLPTSIYNGEEIQINWEIIDDTSNSILFASSCELNDWSTHPINITNDQDLISAICQTLKVESTSNEIPLSDPYEIFQFVSTDLSNANQFSPTTATDLSGSPTQIWVRLDRPAELDERIALKVTEISFYSLLLANTAYDLSVVYSNEINSSGDNLVPFEFALMTNSVKDTTLSLDAVYEDWVTIPIDNLTATSTSTSGDPTNWDQFFVGIEVGNQIDGLWVAPFFYSDTHANPSKQSGFTFFLASIDGPVSTVTTNTDWFIKLKVEEFYLE